MLGPAWAFFSITKFILEQPELILGIIKNRPACRWHVHMPQDMFIQQGFIYIQYFIECIYDYMIIVVYLVVIALAIYLYVTGIKNL